MAIADQQCMLFVNPTREGLEAGTKLIGIYKVRASDAYHLAVSTGTTNILFIFPCSAMSLYSTMLGDKIDIFDFGVILLELVSGKPITSIYEVEIMKELVCMIGHLVVDGSAQRSTDT